MQEEEDDIYLIQAIESELLKKLSEGDRFFI